METNKICKSTKKNIDKKITIFWALLDVEFTRISPIDSIDRYFGVLSLSSLFNFDLQAMQYSRNEIILHAIF